MSGVEISTMSITHSAECPLTNKDTAILAGTVTAKGSYKSSGVFMATWRRLLSGGGWTEVSFRLNTIFILSIGKPYLLTILVL